MPRRRSFNSRSREGSDGIKKPLCGAGVWVSIRAPARGATHNPAGRALRGRCFNSRSREGSDAQSGRACHASAMFQFALPRGERRRAGDYPGHDTRFQFALPRGERPSGLGSSPHGRAGFNSRSREGSDTIRQGVPCGGNVSIRAPARGATFAPRLGAIICRSFNSRSREGSDRQHCRRRARPRRFNSRSREGSDPRR